ncbi:FecR family protein [Bacteroides gallinaceum]|nr:FecR family protein [Bacteroides gallinaceum]MDM8323641.1 FecR family protein [Bacteroides gallinaceum]
MENAFADIVIEAPVGARTCMYLPDGTQVWLNACSRLTYSQGFGINDRNLKLEGEGYFEVSRNEQLPFIIHTQEVDVTVLGTQFNFKNYADDSEASVSLLSGKVKLCNHLRQEETLYLQPNEKVTLNKLTGEMKTTRTQVQNSKIWTHDELFFDEELLEDIAKKLMRNYDVKIEVADSLKNTRFYGSFKMSGSTIEQVLETISSTNRMKYKQEKGIYILY